MFKASKKKFGIGPWNIVKLQAMKERKKLPGENHVLVHVMKNFFYLRYSSSLKYTWIFALASFFQGKSHIYK